MTPNQGDFFNFQLPQPFTQIDERGHEGELAGINRVVASAVAQMLRDCGKSRHEVAILMSELVDDTVTKAMLDAYASEGREDHNISMGRFMALTAATSSYSVLGDLLRKIGATILVGEEIYLAEMGHLDAQERDIKRRKAQLKMIAKPINRKGGE